jgi:acetyl-CoA C-acetyltransferase
MKFEHAALSAAHLWSSPFVRWQGRLADVSSLDVAVAVTRDALAARAFDGGRVEQIVLGTTIPSRARSTPRRGSPRASA